MKHFIYAFAALFISHSAALASSSSDIDHYEAITPNSTAHALTLMQDKSSEIGQHLSKAEPKDSDMEAIHRLSYTLEASAEYLQEHAPTLSKQESYALRHAAHEVHEHSEEHELAETRESHAAFVKALNVAKAKLQ